MDKMKKIDVNEKDPITYLNKKRDHKFFFISSSIRMMTYLYRRI